MSPESNYVIEARGLHKTFGRNETRVEAIRGIDLCLTSGEFIAAMGPSGSGKSTLLHLLGGLVPPTEGTIRLDKRDLTALSDDELTLIRRKRIGFVFQSYNLLTVLTAAENVSLPLILDGVDETEAHRRAVDALEQTGLTQRQSHLPREMSGGEQQRVAIARALVNRPAILLADEPTGNLDTVTSDQIMALLRRLVNEQGQTILMVTHNPNHAAMADRLIRLQDGRIVDEQKLKQARSTYDETTRPGFIA